MEEDGQTRAAEERKRLIDAFTKLAAESGYEATTGAKVAAQAGLPTETFYEHFPTELQCLVAAHDAFYERLQEAVEDAIEDGEEDEWPTTVRRAVAACLEYLADSERHARLFAVDAVRAGPTILERRFFYTSVVAEHLREGRRHFPQATQLAEGTEWGLVAGALACVTSHLLAEEGPFPPRVTAELTEFLLVPYLGAEAAAQIAALGEPGAAAGSQS